MCQEAFSEGDPKPGRLRLKFSDDRTTDTWKALQGGARSFGAACFTAICNPVAHEHDYLLSTQEALERLAALSVLARWIDQCEVEAV